MNAPDIACAKKGHSSSNCNGNKVPIAKSSGKWWVNPVSTEPEVIRVRTLFLSDVHLGTKGCQADLLIDFLRHYDADTVYLVGDIVDGWRLKAGWYWPQNHNDVVQKLLRKVRKGTHIVYIPGNHDEFLRDYVGSTFGGIELVDHAIHEGADGNRYLVIHGDQFDMVVRHARWLAFLGDWAYGTALATNTYVNIVRRRLGLTYWSLSAWAKLKVKNAVNFIGRFEELLSSEAQRYDVHGVICGHIHHAAMHDKFGVRYINTGDWVESCSAVVEHYDGNFEILRWTDRQVQVLAEQRAERKRARGQTQATPALPAPAHAASRDDDAVLPVADALKAALGVSSPDAMPATERDAASHPGDPDKMRAA